MPGIFVKNESSVDVMAVLSQLTALQWNTEPIKPGETYELKCGRVWFTLTANVFDAKRLPTRGGVAARVAMMANFAILAGPVLLPAALIVTGGVSRYTSNFAKTHRTLAVKGVKRDGVYADGRVVVISGLHTPDGLYHLYFDRVEWYDGNGEITQTKDLPKPKIDNADFADEPATTTPLDPSIASLQEPLVSSSAS